MRILAIIVVIVVVLFLWVQNDPASFNKQKDKLKEKVAESIFQKNITNTTLVEEKNYTMNVTQGQYPLNTTNYGRPKKIVEFLCQSTEDCMKYIPNTPWNVYCNNSTGECVSP